MKITASLTIIGVALAGTFLASPAWAFGHGGGGGGGRGGGGMRGGFSGGSFGHASFGGGFGRGSFGGMHGSFGSFGHGSFGGTHFGHGSFAHGNFGHNNFSTVGFGGHFHHGFNGNFGRRIFISGGYGYYGGGYYPDYYPYTDYTPDYYDVGTDAYGYGNMDYSSSYYPSDSVVAAPVTIAPSPVHDGSDDLIMDIQTALQANGYYKGKIDGEAGPMTRAAIRAFQADHQLPLTGRMDMRLLHALGIN